MLAKIGTIILIVYVIVFLIPKFIYWIKHAKYPDDGTNRDPTGNDNVKPRKPQDYL